MSAKTETKRDSKNIKEREVLYKLFKDRPIDTTDLLLNPGLFMRSGVLTKILFLNEVYQMILGTPGIIMEFGTWLGQNLITFENLRAIYEPFDQTRRIIGFDSYSGYTAFSDKDKKDDVVKEGGYKVPEDYQKYLLELAKYHEQNNVLGYGKRIRTIAGDVTETVPAFFEKYPETIIAFAYFDMALYEPTKVCLREIKPHLVSGSVILLDEFNYEQWPGETLAFKEVCKDWSYVIKKSKLMTDRTFLVIN